MNLMRCLGSRRLPVAMAVLLGWTGLAPGAEIEAEAYLEICEDVPGEVELRLVERVEGGAGRWTAEASEDLRRWEVLGTMFYYGERYVYHLTDEQRRKHRYFRARFEGSDVEERLVEAKNLWMDQGPARYRMTVFFWSSFFFWKGRVDVENGVVTEAEATETNFFEPPEPRAVEDWFAVLEQAIRSRAEVINAEFDPETGYPAEVFIDFSTGISDEEQGWRIEMVTPLD
ncbi:MAG TPA: DUF6174 domain-containing protein [Verrucomicrobiales bacterium]|nr:DUF6174 domain-containing protein [Verrucomicrobiales bacterium]